MTVTVRQIRLVPEEHDLGALRLYREDLVKIATEAARAGALKIVAGDFEATSPDDFAALPSMQLASVTITSTPSDSPAAVEVGFTAGSATVRLTEPSLETRGVLVGIQQVCETRSLRWRSRMPRSQNATYTALLIGCIAAAFNIVFVILAISPTKGTPGWISSPATIALASAAFVASAGYVALDSRPRVMIINVPRADRPTFWERTRDSWKVGIITTVGGVIAGYLLAKLTSK
jgi:hypothetical protein